MMIEWSKQSEHFKNFNMNNLSVCTGWSTDQVKVDVIYFWVCTKCQHEIYKRLPDRRAVNHNKIKRTERYSEM